MLASVVNPLLTTLQRFTDDWRRNDDFRAQPHQEIVHRFVAEVVDLIDSNHGLARAILNLLVERPPDFDTANIGRSSGSPEGNGPGDGRIPQPS